MNSEDSRIMHLHATRLAERMMLPACLPGKRPATSQSLAHKVYMRRSSISRVERRESSSR